jgi:hypothetical protein
VDDADARRRAAGQQGSRADESCSRLGRNWKGEKKMEGEQVGAEREEMDGVAAKPREGTWTLPF